MKNFKALLVISIILLSGLTAFSQRKLSGKVVEVINGRTAVIEIGTSGKLKVVLQNIETPEPEQPLYGVVKDHLGKFLLGKTADVFPKGIMESSTVAQVFVGGIDVSQQMLRDGAAWYALVDKTNKKTAETEVYLSNEAQAKAEKRGVWGIEGLKPAWEFRAAKAERERAAELARLEEVRKQNQNQYQKISKEKPRSFNQLDIISSKQGRDISQVTPQVDAKEDIDQETIDRILFMIDLSSVMTGDFANVYNSNKKSYDYIYFKETIDSINYALDSMQSRFKKTANQTLVKENQKIIDDIYKSLNLMDRGDNGHYKGELAVLADKYNVLPTIGLSGEKIILKQVILGNMLSRMNGNFTQLKMNIIRG